MNGDTFAGYHPLVNLTFFITVIGFAMFFTHPICLLASLMCSFAYAVYAGGAKTMRFGYKYMLPALIITALLNPAFNHRGATILTYLPDGNPLTLESILYGISAAVMLITVIFWFSCFNAVMTSDKLIFLFGRVIPALSLILSMILRFVPRYRERIKVISDAQKCIGRDMSSGNIFKRLANGMKILSIMTTWALENAIETADSMKNRGYGLPGRTAFSIYRFTRRDAYALLYIFVCAVIVLAGAATGAYRFIYYPVIAGKWTGAAGVIVFASYLALGAFPLIINIVEDAVWKSIQSRI